MKYSRDEQMLRLILAGSSLAHVSRSLNESAESVVMRLRRVLRRMHKREDDLRYSDKTRDAR